MIFADGAGALLLLGLWLFCIVDVITTDESQVRNLPKIAWVFIVILLFDLGSLLWLVAGRNWQGAGAARSPARGASGAYPEYDRPGRYVPADPQADEAFLRQIRDRAEEQRRSYEQRRREELQAEEDRLKKPPTDS